MIASDFLKKLPSALNGDAIDGVQCTIQFNASSPVVVTIGDGGCAVQDGTADAPDVSLTIADDDLVALLTGKLSGMEAFMGGKLQIDGDLMLAKQIPEYFDTTKLA